jgi:hypothetical protein
MKPFATGRTRPLRAGTHRWRAWSMLLVIPFQSVLFGCATWQPPERVDDAGLRARAETATVNDVRVSAAVLSSEDSRAMFSADVNGAGVQPVWVEVDNRTSQLLWLLHSGTDPNYFSPLEVSWGFHAPLAGARNAAIDAHFDRLAFANPIPPGETRAGILFTNPHRMTRLLNVDLLGQRFLAPFSLFLNVPDDQLENLVLAMFQRRFAEVEVDYQDADHLRAGLERLSCCATRAGGGAGDPINVVLIGTLEDVASALVRRGYRADERVEDRAQLLFGRPPDAAARKAGQQGVSANWLRLWLAPLKYRGQPVFLVQAGRPIGGRFALADGERVVLHPDVDEARNLFLQDMIYSGALAQLAFSRSSAQAGPGQMNKSVSGSDYRTDGLRAVLFLTTRPLALSDVQILDWEPYLESRAGTVSPKEMPTP